MEGHLQQLNEHGQCVLVANASNAAAVAGHVVNNLRGTRVTVTGSACVPAAGGG